MLQTAFSFLQGWVSEDKVILFHEGQVTINEAAALDEYSDDDMGFGAELRRTAAARPTHVSSNGQVWALLRTRL